jgi:ABC-2 type transport system permease protein
MSARSTLRALPTLLRVGFADAVAYRAEMIVWVLATTMPLVMLALWLAVARDAPIGGYGAPQFTAYFLATFVVRQLTGVWVAWQMNLEVRQGTLSMRLLRPIHPLLGYTAEHVAGIPMRIIVSLPVALVALWLAGTRDITHDPALVAIWVLSLVGAWLISLFAGFAVGSLAFWMESSAKVMDVWLALYFVMSGYLVPVSLFPGVVRVVADCLPFRYQLGLPVEIITGAHSPGEALVLVARQWAFVVLGACIALVAWRRGLARFSAYGG